MHMHTPPKSFHPSMDKTHKWEEGKLGANENKEISTQNITKRRKKRNTYHKDIRKYKQRWWYTNRGIRPPTKIYNPQSLQYIHHVISRI